MSKRVIHKGHCFDGTGDSNLNTNNNSGTNIGSYLGIATTLAPTLVDLFSENAEEKRLKSLGDSMVEDAKEFGDTDFAGSNATLLQMSKNLPVWKSVTLDDLGGTTDVFGAGLSGAISGASAGAMTGNPWIAGGAALVNGLLGAWNAEDKNRQKADQVARINQEGEKAEKALLDKFRSAVTTTDAKNDRWRMQNYFNTNYAADGGLLETNGAVWQSGSDFVDNGGTHEMNPFGGVQYGIASDGLPNFVEEGEVVIDLEDSNDAGHTYAEGGSPSTSKYVLSNRVLFEEPEMDLLRKVTDKPEQYAGKSYADIYKDIFDKNRVKERINSQYIKDYVTSLNERMAKTQEATKLRKQQEELIAELKKATPEEQEMIMQQFGMNQQQPMQGEYLAAEGGKIYIKPSKRGTFTAAAKSRGMGVQEFASKVLANKEDYSPAMVKKANFARNASHWHPDGGFFTTAGTNGLLSNQSLIVPSTNYNQAKYFTNIVDANGNYLPGYVDWVNSLTQADYDYLSGLEGFDKTLNPNLATFKRRATDKKFQNTHAWINSLYRPKPVVVEEPTIVDGDFLATVAANQPSRTEAPWAQPLDTPVRGIIPNEPTERERAILAAAHPETQNIAQNYWNSQNVLPINDTTTEEITEQMEDTKVMGLLKGFRGEAPGDIDAVKSAIVRVAKLTLDFPEISELDINPIFVYEKGSSALDIKIKLG